MSFDQNYIDWKDWRQEDFAAYTPADAAYFQAEIAKSGKTDLASMQQVIEIGFGNGKFLGWAKAQNWQVMGVEMNEELLARARAAGFTAQRFADLSAQTPGSVDLIVAFDVLEHMQQPAIESVFSQAATLLRRGGVLLARVPNADSPLGLCVQHGDFTHVQALGYYKFEYLARKYGLEITHYGMTARLPHGLNLRAALGRILARPLQHLGNKLAQRYLVHNNKIIMFSSCVVAAFRRPLA